MKAWLNGIPIDPNTPLFPLASPVVERGDALWEAARAYRGHVLSWPVHVGRITSGARRAALTTLDLTDRIVADTQIARDFTATYEHAKLYIMLAPNLTGDFDVISVVSEYAGPSDELYTRGYNLIVSDLPHPRLGGFGKSTSYQWSRIAQRWAEQAGADSALVLDGEHVVEATTAAVAWLRDDTWFTVSDDAGCLPSTTIRALESLGHPFERSMVTVPELCASKAVILVSSLRLAIGVGSIRAPGIGTNGEHRFETPDRYAAPLRALALSEVQ